MKQCLPILAIGLYACMNLNNGPQTYQTILTEAAPANNQEEEPTAKKHFAGALFGGLKGDSIFFDVSANGQKLENLTFKGYWRCSGKLERISAVGPDGSFPITRGVAKGYISDPPDGGSTAWRFDIDTKITGNTATGTFRMNINNLGCDTYVLKFTAVAK